MHRVNRLNELVKEWLALGLTETCSRADSFTRIQIHHIDNELVFIPNRLPLNGSKLKIGLFEGAVAFTTGYLESEEHAMISNAIWALETAVENY